MKRLFLVFFLVFSFVARADLTQQQIQAAFFEALKDYAQFSSGLPEIIMTMPFGSDFDPLESYLDIRGSPDGMAARFEFWMRFFYPYLACIGASSNDIERISSFFPVPGDSQYNLAEFLSQIAESASSVDRSLSPLEFRFDSHGEELKVAAPDIEEILADISYNESLGSGIAEANYSVLSEGVMPLLRVLVSNMIPTVSQLRSAEDITNMLPYDLAVDHNTDFQSEYDGEYYRYGNLQPDWSEKFTDNPYDHGGSITNTLLNGVLGLVDGVDPVTSPELIIMGSYDTPAALAGAPRLPRIAVDLEDNLRQSNALRFVMTVMSALWLIVGAFYKFSALQQFVDWYTKKSKGI